MRQPCLLSLVDDSLQLNNSALGLLEYRRGFLIRLSIENGAHSFVIESQSKPVSCSKGRDPDFAVRRVQRPYPLQFILVNSAVGPEPVLQFVLDMVRQNFHLVLRTAATATAGNLTGTLTQPVFNESARLIHIPPLRHHQGRSRCSHGH